MNTRKKKMLIALMTGSLMTGTVFAASASTPAEGQSIVTSGVAHRTQSDMTNLSTKKNASIVKQQAEQAQNDAVRNLPEPLPLLSTLPGTPVGYFSGINDVHIDQTVPKYAVAVLPQGQEMSLPYGDAVSDSEIAPYIGKTITSIKFSALPDDKLADVLKKRLALRIGDTVNGEYLRHDVNSIGSSGLFAVVKPAFQVVPEGVSLVYHVRVNPTVRGIELTGNESIPASTLGKLLNVQPGTVLNTTLISKDVSNINTLYNNWGYMLNHVSEVKMDDRGILHIRIAEAHVEDIFIRGNTKTKDRVILREMRFGKGDIFNKALVSRSIQRIYNTGYFEDVNVRLLQGQRNRQNVILEIDVAEQKTGSVTIGAGYSESDGLVGIIGLSETNLRGTGDKVALNWEFGGKSSSNKNHSLSYTHPWLNKYGDSLGFNFYDRKGQYTDYGDKGAVASYEKKTRGFSVTYGRSRSEYTGDYFTLEAKNNEYSRYLSGLNYKQDETYKTYFKNNFGRVHTLTWSHVFDNRDNVFDPSQGKRLAFTGIMAGHGLGGNFNYTKLIGEARLYRALGHGHVAALRVMGGTAFGSLPYNDLFTLGGADTIRGYEDDEFRGNKMYAVTLEYRYPIAKKIQGVVFTDVGNAWGGTENISWYHSSHKVHESAGVGFRVTTPIGPVRLDYAWGQNGGKFHFSFGGKF